MDLITVDFETYYSKEFSLSKMTTEEYINDDHFEVVGVAVKVNNGKTRWFTGSMEATQGWLNQFDWGNSAALAHNMMFDGAILAWRFGIHPKVMFDTLSMARAVHGTQVGGSLAKLAEHYELGAKGTEVVMAMGKRRADFTLDEMQAYAGYCKNDVDLTYELFQKLMAVPYPKAELKLIDMTLRMYTQPVFELDLPALESHLYDVQDKKEALLSMVDADRETLMSNDKFAQALRDLGVDPPVKLSARTGKESWAFAKTDEAFKALTEHDDPRVQALVSARLGTKSTLEETRTERFIAMAKRVGVLPVPLKYYGAHTGRWAGMDKVNLQNLPSRGPAAGKIKEAIVAPKGYVVLNCDSSQIEARMVAWLAGQADLTQAFEDKEDVYKIMASAIYDKPVDAIDKHERAVGKSTILGCFAEDTPVLTDSGIKPIIAVKPTDMVWDGVEWVSHAGVICQGMKETIRKYGVAATPDHEILVGDGWREWSAVITSPSLFQSALRKATLPSKSGPHGWSKGSQLDGTQLLDASAAGKGLSTGTTSLIKTRSGAVSALGRLVQILARSIGDTLTFFRTTSTGFAYSTASPPAYLGATALKQPPLSTTGGGVSKYMSLGAKTSARFSSTYSLWKGGTTPSWRSTGSITTGGMNRATYALLTGAPTCITGATLERCNEQLMTYDIAFAGPRNRFTIVTDAGPVIVHNCGYGMGPVRFRDSLVPQGINLDPSEAQHIINTYRNTYSHIPLLWRRAQQALEAIANGQHIQLGPDGVMEFSAKDKGFRMPSGLWQKYPTLERKTDAEGKVQFGYTSRYGFVRMHGPKLVENLSQGLARCVIGEQMLHIAKRYRPVLTVHDSVVIIAPEAEMDEAAHYLAYCMSWRPDWARTLPLACEVEVGRSYGDLEEYKL